MDVFASALAANPMQTRQDAVTALLDLIRPLKSFYSPGDALLKVGNTAAHYGEKDARMEGWARILWGLGPLFGGDNTTLPAEQQAEIAAWGDLYRTGLINGTDPSHPEYWGDIFDYDQKMVETAALDLACPGYALDTADRRPEAERLPLAQSDECPPHPPQQLAFFPHLNEYDLCTAGSAL